MTAGHLFPTIRGRNLEGLDVEMPKAFDGEWNIVAIAFHRQHQTLVDSWATWFEEQVLTDPDIRFYEVPAIARFWAPARKFIDGGMAAAIRNPVVLRRTFTVYGDLQRLTLPLDIRDRSTITLLCLDQKGHVRWTGHGGYTTAVARELESVLATNWGNG